jgi:hypothetical protein
MWNRRPSPSERRLMPRSASVWLGGVSPVGAPVAQRSSLAASSSGATLSMANTLPPGASASRTSDQNPSNRPGGTWLSQKEKKTTS